MALGYYELEDAPPPPNSDPLDFDSYFPSIFPALATEQFDSGNVQPVFLSLWNAITDAVRTWDYHSPQERGVMQRGFTLGEDRAVKYAAVASPTSLERVSGELALALTLIPDTREPETAPFSCSDVVTETGKLTHELDTLAAVAVKHALANPTYDELRLRLWQSSGKDQVIFERYLEAFLNCHVCFSLDINLNRHLFSELFRSYLQQYEVPLFDMKMVVEMEDADWSLPIASSMLAEAWSEAVANDHLRFRSQYLDASQRDTVHNVSAQLEFSGDLIARFFVRADAVSIYERQTKERGRTNRTTVIEIDDLKTSFKPLAERSIPEQLVFCLQVGLFYTMAKGLADERERWLERSIPDVGINDDAVWLNGFSALHQNTNVEVAINYRTFKNGTFKLHTLVIPEHFGQEFGQLMECFLIPFLLCQKMQGESLSAGFKWSTAKK